MTEAGKGGDLAGELATVQSAVQELSNFMTTKVRPLSSKGESDFESALKDVATPKGEKGLKHIMQFIDNRVDFIKNTLKMI